MATVALVALLACKKLTGRGRDAPPDAGSAITNCAGRSLDPPNAEIVEASDRGHGYERVSNDLAALSNRYPRSATVLRARGSHELDQTKGSAGHSVPEATRKPFALRAIDFFKKALGLHEAGCQLAELDLYVTYTGLAEALSAAGDDAAAKREHQRIVKRWPRH
ncbi:MAG: hypothetical protein ACRETX_14390, partial [Steroidobacteraceae bacterium]